MVKISKIQWFVLVAVGIGLVFYFSSRNVRRIDVKDDLISFISINKGRLLDFAEKLNSEGLADSNFYVEHRFKENKYHFFHLRGQNLDGEFNLTPNLYEDFTSSAKTLNVKNIWKYPDENFYTVVIRGMEKFDNKRLFFLVLKKNEHQFVVPSNSSINSRDTTSLSEDFGNTKDILVPDRRIWVKLKDD